MPGCGDHGGQGLRVMVRFPACQGEGEGSGGFVTFIGRQSLPFLSCRLAEDSA